MSKTRIALVGIGKIARDAHVPTIAASTDFELVAAGAARASGLRRGIAKGAALTSNTSPSRVATPSANDSVAVPKKCTCTSPGRRNDAYLK